MMNKYMNNEQIKMRFDFELIEEADCYILILNEEDHLIFPKIDYSRLKAECEAMDQVNSAIERHGENAVYYTGFFSNLEKQSA